MSVFAALGYMALGAVIVEVFELKAWHRYKEGKKEGFQAYRKDGR